MIGIMMWLWGVSASLAAGREKIMVGVATFSDQTGKRLAGPATDYVTETLVRLKYFRVLERSQMDQVLKELARQQSDLVDEKTAVELGRHLGAQATVVGSVSGAGYNVAKIGCVGYGPNGKQIQVTCLEAKATATLNVRMVKIETGEVMFSEVLTGSAEKTYQPGSQPEPEAAMIDEALRKAAHDVYGPVQKAFPLTGTVVKKEGQEVWVDLGSDWGVQRGRGMLIRKLKGEEIKNPRTGELVGYTHPEVAHDTCSEVTPEMCKMKVGKREAEKIKEGQIAEAKPEFWY
jgi:hypothetical protein